MVFKLLAIESNSGHFRLSFSGIEPTSFDSTPSISDKTAVFYRPNHASNFKLLTSAVKKLLAKNRLLSSCKTKNSQK